MKVGVENRYISLRKGEELILILEGEFACNTAEKSGLHLNNVGMVGTYLLLYLDTTYNLFAC